MHSLLQRQIRKYLPTEFRSKPEMDVFLEAIEKSYENYDEKFSMLHRATTISSDELYAANRQLEKEALRQQNILTSLEDAIKSLTNNPNKTIFYDASKNHNINMEQLAKYISNLATQMSEVTAEKDKLLKDLEIKNQSLNDYAQVVSHDLKSPIRNISALMSWILDDEKEKFSDESKENCSLVSENLLKMDKLISGILNHATLGNTNEQRVSFALKDLLAEIQRTIYIPENVAIEFDEELPTIFFEKDRLEKVFMNLMLNAVTATEHLEEGIIKIGYLPDENFWKFRITDNGTGIPKQHQQSIFEMFKKLENDKNATGIGLAIVKKTVDFYDGEVWLESEENKGTTFYFTLKKK